MPDFILIDGDKVSFMPMFGLAVVVPRLGELAASGRATLDGKKVCVEGDEQSVSVPNCTYLTPQYSIAGTGTLKIATLAGDHKAAKTSNGGKAVLLKGSTFTAKLEVQVRAQQPPPGPGSPIPDPTPQYSGTGMFITTNVKLRGT